MKKLIISGTRTCDCKDAIFTEINKFVGEIGAVDEIVTGGSTGVDMIAKMYAESKNLKYKEIEPDWQDDLNAAGMVRDARMAEYGTHLLVLSNGISKEAKNLIEEAKHYNLVIKTVKVISGVPGSIAARPARTPAI